MSSVNTMSTSPTSPLAAPKTPPNVKAQVIALHLAGETNRDIAKKLGVGKNTIPLILAEGNLGNKSSVSVESILARAGLTTETVANDYAQLVHAEETKVATWEGKFTDQLQVPDNTTRLNAARDIAKMLGMISDASVNTAQLFVKLPNQVVTRGHSEGCTCDECLANWEQQAITIQPVLP